MRSQANPESAQITPGSGGGWLVQFWDAGAQEPSWSDAASTLDKAIVLVGEYYEGRGTTISGFVNGSSWAGLMMVPEQ